MRGITTGVSAMVLLLVIVCNGVQADPIEKGNNTKLIVSKTESRAKKDAFNRERGLKRLQKKLLSGKLTKAHINNKGYNKYLKMEGEIKISIDMDRYENDIAWDGIKGYVTNTELNKEEVIKKCLDQHL